MGRFVAVESFKRAAGDYTTKVPKYCANHLSDPLEYGSIIGQAMR